MDNNQPNQETEEKQLEELPIMELQATISDKDELYLVLSEMMGYYLPTFEGVSLNFLKGKSAPNHFTHQMIYRYHVEQEALLALRLGPPLLGTGVRRDQGRALIVICCILSSGVRLLAQ